MYEKQISFFYKINIDANNWDVVEKMALIASGIWVPGPG